MRIESLNLIGFKSFSDKTTFNFHPGLTSIVGPNGCGKSNVVDAFKWVLGEQSARSLRGDHMEDVIFNGSAAKKPKGMAEVSLVLSGVSNGGAPGSDQLTVTRRLFRSGESEYLINQVPCRLKDIKNMFLDTGLELKAYSILEQGRIGEILNSKPGERRFLIEEVAGVMKYNVRKAEALQKLENSKLNLQRLQDIINEVKRQINSIDRYAKRAERYKRIFDEIKGIEIKISVRDVTAMRNELEGLVESESSLKSKEAELASRIHSTDAMMEERKLLRVEKEKRLDEIQERLNSAERGFIEEEGKISLARSDCENLKERLQRLHIREEELSETGRKLGGQIAGMESRKNDLGAGLSGIESLLDSQTKELSAFEAEIAEAEKDLEAKRRHIFHKAEEVSSIKNEINSLTLISENLEKKEKECLEDMESIRQSMSLLSQSLKEVKEEYDRLNTELRNKYSEKETITNDTKRLDEELAVIEEGLYKDREDLAAMDSRRESLLELFKKNKSEVNGNIKIICRVADVFETLPEHETAIEAVLGEKLSASIVDDRREIKKALFFIKEHKAGRSVFIPIDASPYLQVSSSFPFPDGGVVGKATDLVKVKEGFDKIALSLLHDVIIVDTLDAAFNLWQTLPPGSNARYFVTLDGEVLESSGVVSAGLEKGVLKMKREIRALEKNIENKKNSVESSERKVTELKDLAASLKNDLSSIGSEISRLEKSFHEAGLKTTSLQDGELREQKRLEFLSSELESERNERSITAERLAEKNKEFNAREQEKISIEADTKGLYDVLAEKKSLHESLRSRCTESMLSRASLKEKMDSLSAEKDRLDAEIKAIAAKKEHMAEEYQKVEEDIKLKEDEIHQREASIKTLILDIGGLKAGCSELREILEAQTAELLLIEKQQKSFSDELTSVRKAMAQVDVRKTELSLRVAHINENIKNIYSIDLANISEEYFESNQLLPGEEERVNTLREKLQEIGPVNLGTLEELEELKTRHDFLTKQQEDLLKSMESLEETIAKINRTTKSRLEEAFEALNEKFKEVFTTLFGKGRAELVLTGEDILAAGIEIVAQPPGKKLQNLMLLSGGEKALTALALLFAGFMIKPTPLCLLDEVDAPLDESNTDRFTSLIDELSKSIQFIVITHNRRTMEVADYLYGVTMEEPGISKVVSIHLAEAEAV